MIFWRIASEYQYIWLSLEPSFWLCAAIIKSFYCFLSAKIVFHKVQIYLGPLCIVYDLHICRTVQMRASSARTLPVLKGDSNLLSGCLPYASIRRVATVYLDIQQQSCIRSMNWGAFFCRKVYIKKYKGTIAICWEKFWSQQGLSFSPGHHWVPALLTAWFICKHLSACLSRNESKFLSNKGSHLTHQRIGRKCALRFFSFSEGQTYIWSLSPIAASDRAGHTCPTFEGSTPFSLFRLAWYAWQFWFFLAVWVRPNIYDLQVVPHAYAASVRVVSALNLWTCILQWIGEL